MDNATLFEAGGHRRVLGEIILFDIFTGVKVIQNTVELVETMRSRQKLVAVAQMIFAELTCRIAQRLEQIGQRRVFFLQSNRGSRQADRAQADPDWILSSD